MIPKTDNGPVNTALRIDESKPAGDKLYIDMDVILDGARVNKDRTVEWNLQVPRTREWYTFDMPLVVDGRANVPPEQVRVYGRVEQGRFVPTELYNMKTDQRFSVSCR